MLICTPFFCSLKQYNVTLHAPSSQMIMNKSPLDSILIFEPNYKTVIWGGSRIPELKGEKIDCQHIGESWEISSVPGHESVVASGTFKGLNISELSHIYGAELLGDAVTARYGKIFPLLIKIIDACQILSVQVHPNDKLAAERHNSRGKSEMWYVIEADKDSKIYSGLRLPLTPGSYASHIADKTIMDVVATHQSKAGQFYYIPSGTLHSIGAGNLVAEIQESSDITYRVYDHDRTDVYGNPRQLHTHEAREAIDYRFPNDIDPTAKIYERSTISAVKCEHFTVDFYKLDNESVGITVSRQSFTAILVVEGSVTIKADSESRTLTAGHSALIPAFVSKLEIKGTGRALAAHI